MQFRSAKHQSHNDTIFLKSFIKLLRLTYLIVQPEMIWIAWKNTSMLWGVWFVPWNSLHKVTALAGVNWSCSVELETVVMVPAAWDLFILQRRQTDFMVVLADIFWSVQDFTKGLQYNSQVVFVPMVRTHRAVLESSFLWWSLAEKYYCS